MSTPLSRRALGARALATAFALPLGAVLTRTPLVTPAYAAAGPWAAYRGNNRQSGLSGSPGPRLLTMAWYVSLADDVASSAVIANDGSVYISANNGRVMARLPDGGEKWTFEAGTRVYASPVLGADGEVLIGDTRGRFRALRSEDGTIAWTVSGLGSVRATAAVAEDATVYVGTESGVMLALEARNQGKEKFRVTARSGIVTAPAIADNGDVIWAAQDEELRRMNARGSLIWQKGYGGEIRSAPAIAPDGTVYVGAGGNVVAVNGGSGDVKWTAGTGGSVFASPAIGPDGTVYIGADNGKLLAYSPSGAPKWEYQTGAPILGSAAVSADGIVYVGSSDATVYAFAPNGERLSSYRALDAVEGSIALGADGTVYAGSKDNRLYALRDNVRSVTPSAADRISGEVVRDPASGRVFVIVDGQRRFIPDPETQQLLGLTTPLPRNLNAAELARFPEGAPLPSLKNGAVIRQSNGPIYVIRDGQRLWLRTAEDLAAAGASPAQAQTIEDRLIRTVPLSLQDGFLLKGTGERVFVYGGGTRSWLQTPEALNARGDWSQVHFISDAALNAIPEGQAIG
jgi:outer membrane protein assembly factor BamB